MKYAFILSSPVISPKAGVKVQAEMWGDGLRNLGHQIDMVTNWGGVDWREYDALIVFGFSQGTRSYISGLAKENPNIIIAPIIDPSTSDRVYKFFCKWWGSHKYLRLSSRFHDLWLIRKLPKLWLVRSEEERHYVNYCLEIPHEQIAKVPLHYRIPRIVEFPFKEMFCFHASRLKAPNKNVCRIVEAAKKYGFQLKLAGHLMGESELAWMRNLIGDAKNIEYVGEVSETELQNMYKRAKVFALPSLQEGVGMVALEAAAYGCEIVLTNYGAPKEYYDGQAIVVDPKSVDEIGQAIMKAMNEGFAQPKLKSYIEQHYSERVCMQLLNDTLEKAVIK